MKAIFMFLSFILFIAHAQSQTSNLPAYGIYTSASDYTAGNLTNGFTTKDHNHKLRDEATRRVYINNNGVAHTYPYDSIWGFRRASSDWRIFNGRIYKVVQNGKACVYIRPTKTDMSVPVLTRFETTYFSATPDSPVYPLTQENLLTVFRSNSALVTKVSSLRPSYPVTKAGKTTGTYEFMSWL